MRLSKQRNSIFMAMTEFAAHTAHDQGDKKYDGIRSLQCRWQSSLRFSSSVELRNAHFERKSTGIHFNQDRDREEFAASLSKRYTYNKSVPRCDIPRENWQTLMKNRPASVYLHYYNREDAERASHEFRDDYGNPLELRREYKAGVVLSRSLSPAPGRFQNMPRRSCSSERAPEPSPTSSMNNRAHNAPSLRRDRPNNERRFSRFDRGPPGERPMADGQYGPRLSGNKRSRELMDRRSRSGSRSASKSFASQPYEISSRSDAEERGDGNTEQNLSASARDVNGDTARSREKYDAADKPSQDNSLNGDTGPSSNEGQKKQDQEGQEDGEIGDSVVSVNPDRNGDDRRERPLESPPRRWQEQSDLQMHNRRDGHLDTRRDRSRSGDYQAYNQRQAWPSWGSNRRGDGWNENDRRRSDGYNSYDNDGRDRRVYLDAARYADRDYQGREYNDRSGRQYPRQF